MLQENFPNFVKLWESKQHQLQLIPEENGFAEAKVKALKRLLLSIVKKEHPYWDHFLPYAIFAFKISYNNCTGFTPFYINHGFESNMPGQLPMAMHHQEAAKEITISPSSYCVDVSSKFRLVLRWFYKSEHSEYEAHKYPRCPQILRLFS